MSYRKAFDEMFIEGTIRTVAQIGIENTRTKHVADYAGFSEATMYRRFPTKEILLRDTFLYIDNQVSNILTQSPAIRDCGNERFEWEVYEAWKKIYRYLIDHKEETIFLIRYRYSSLYTDNVRNMRQAYNGSFRKVYEAFGKRYGAGTPESTSFLINYIFEMTLCFAEKVITGKLEDNEQTERSIWMAVSSAARTFAQMPEGEKPDGDAKSVQRGEMDKTKSCSL